MLPGIFPVQTRRQGQMLTQDFLNQASWKSATKSHIMDTLWGRSIS